MVKDASMIYLKKVWRKDVVYQQDNIVIWKIAKDYQG